MSLTISGTEIVRLDYPNRPIRMRVSNVHEATFRANACQKEPWTVAFVDGMQHGDVFYDVGANVGPYSMIAATAGHRVIAIEPGFANYTALLHNAVLNDCLDKIICLPVALGPATGLTWMHYQDLQPGAANHVIGQPVRTDSPLWFHRQRIMQWRLDDLVGALDLPWPTHIKIDVDGGELGVLEGAAESLASPSLKFVLSEMQLDQEQAVCERFVALGLVPAARFDQRGGRPIQGICYRLFASQMIVAQLNGHD